MIAVLSEAYVKKPFCLTELYKAWIKDPVGEVEKADPAEGGALRCAPDSR